MGSMSSVPCKAVELQGAASLVWIMGVGCDPSSPMALCNSLRLILAGGMLHLSFICV